MIHIEFDKNNLIKSPLNYTGGKYRLLPQILPLFPDNINTFVDLFCGAGNVGINIKANKIIMNDCIFYLKDMFETWSIKSYNELLSYINETVHKYNIITTSDIGFKKLREEYNKNKKIEDLFILVCFSFNFQMRFNNKQEYNSSFGKEASTLNKSILNNLKRFSDKLKTNTYEFKCDDFMNFDYSKLTSKDLVYADPPYFLSCGVYQDGKRGFKGWNKDYDLKLLHILDELNNKNIKFALSNLIENKGVSNEHLKEWSNKYNIHYLDINYNSCNYHRKTQNKDTEVLITNY